jgi:hypothetical protein
LGRAHACGDFGLAQARSCARGNPLAGDGELGFQLSLPHARTEAVDQVVDLLLAGLDRNIGYWDCLGGNGVIGVISRPDIDLAPNRGEGAAPTTPYQAAKSVADGMVGVRRLASF